MPDLNLDLDYLTHPKTQRLVATLGPGAELLPIRLWIYVGKFHFQDGLLIGYSPADVESLAGWTGEPGKAIEALLRRGPGNSKSGFLEAREGGYAIHDWEEHAGHIAFYHQRAVDNANKRWGKNSNSRKASRSASSNTPAGQGRAGNSSSSSLNPTLLPKEELGHEWFRIPEFAKAWDDWLEARRKKKNPATESAQEKLFAELLTDNLSGGILSKAIAIVNKSMTRGWAGFFPLESSSLRNGHHTGAAIGDDLEFLQTGGHP